MGWVPPLLLSMVATVARGSGGGGYLGLGQGFLKSRPGGENVWPFQNEERVIDLCIKKENWVIFLF
jgi:hypothetical protein